MARTEVSKFRLWLYSITYLFVSLLISILVTDYSYSIGERVLDTSISWQVFYFIIKLLLGAWYLRLNKLPWIEMGVTILIALLIRYFAEGTFTIALIGMMLARRIFTKPILSQKL